MKIAIAGTGYVGLSLAVLLAQHNDVIAVDILPEKVEMINRGKSPIHDEYVENSYPKRRKEVCRSGRQQMEYQRMVQRSLSSLRLRQTMTLRRTFSTALRSNLSSPPSWRSIIMPAL